MSVLARLRHKQPRLPYFLRNVAKLCVPRAVWIARREAAFQRLAALPHEELDELGARVESYVRVGRPFEVDPSFRPLRLRHFRDQRNYYYDLFEHLRCFPDHLRVAYRFGDDTSPPATPTLVKARSIHADNGNSVVFKLNRIRHFKFVDDRQAFADKWPLLVWRGHATRPNRLRFLERYFEHPLCDVGQAHARREVKDFAKPYLSVPDQLRYKFILSIEGNDAATNLKWILSSNSLCFMTRPKVETWFLESTLVPGRHYVELADDHSDLEQKVRHFTDHPQEALSIIEQAHAFVAPFRDRRREALLCWLVLQRYFELSGQLPALALPRSR